MYTSILASLAFLSGTAFAVTGALGNAAIVTDNLPGMAFQAILQDKDTTSLRGQITGVSNSNGTGVDFNINFYGFPAEDEGPFLYHIHAFPVPSDGNCTGTLGHLDPYVRGESPPCDPTQPETCQVGDLSGKHGNITKSPFQITYLELYTSSLEGPGAFFGNRSIVVHNQNLTRLNCGNFTIVSEADTGANGSMGSSPSFTGSASSTVVSAGVVGGIILAVMTFML